MYRTALALGLLTFLAPATMAEGATQPVLELGYRQVLADPAFPLPASGRFYLFVKAPISRKALARAGLRFLGLAGQGVYLVSWTGEHRETLIERLKQAPEILGTAVFAPDDLLGPRLRSALRAMPSGGSLEPVQLGFFESPKGVITKSMWGSTPPQIARIQNDWLRVRLQLSPEQVHQWLQLPELAYAELPTRRVVTNQRSRKLLKSDRVAKAPLSLTGSGIRVGVWDGGRVFPHNAFQDRLTVVNARDYDDHATHVAGTIGAAPEDRPELQGHAPQVHIYSYDMNNQVFGARHQAQLSYDLDLDNHSWGVDPELEPDFSTYDQTALGFDAQARYALMIAVKAAGNAGGQGQRVSDGYRFDSLSPDSTALNTIVVGAVSPTGSPQGFSSVGPTEDGRLKPDIMADGVEVRSTTPYNEYAPMTGTSMATPGVTGALALLAEHDHKLHPGRRWAPDWLRGVIMHTALDIVHPGPDYFTGWGVLDVEAAAKVLSDDVASENRMILRDWVRQGDVREFPIEVSAGQPELRVTLSWMDSPFNQLNTVKRLVQDLDLELVDPSGTVHYPFTLDAAHPAREAVQTRPNRSDNLEQARIANPAAGSWKIRVRGHSVTDVNQPAQGFVLISSQPIERLRVQRRAMPADAARVANASGSFEIPFDFDVGKLASFARVEIALGHSVAGLKMHLEAPSGTRYEIPISEAVTQDRFYTVIPDLFYAPSLAKELVNEPVKGSWKVEISGFKPNEDLSQALRRLSLEIVEKRPLNGAPEVTIESDRLTLLGGQTARLKAVATDPDEDPLTFEWSVNLPLTHKLKAVSEREVEFTAPRTASSENVVVEVVVKDDHGHEVRVHKALQVQGNRAPTLKPDTQVYSAKPEANFELTVPPAVDPEQDAVTYRWSVESPKPLQLESEANQVRFWVPRELVGERISVHLFVSDGLAETKQTYRVEVNDLSGDDVMQGCQALSGSDGAVLAGLLGLLAMLARWPRRQTSKVRR